MKKIKIVLSTIVMLLMSGGIAWAVVQTLNGQSGQVQTFANDTNVTISSANNVHSLGWNGILPVARGGSGGSAFTRGSVLFMGPIKIKEDNANFFWDNINNRLGIGTKTPLTAVDVKGTVTATQVTTNSVVASGSNQSISLNPTGTGKVLIGGESLVVARLTGDPASPSTGQIYFDTTHHKFRGYDGISWGNFQLNKPTAAILVVAGGGSGGGALGGGGGAGGVIFNPTHEISAQAYTVTVGGGGSGIGGNGVNSVFADITAFGGGGGGTPADATNGGSGGGGGGGGIYSPTTNGGMTVDTGEGNDGGNGLVNTSNGGGGGGGAGAVGANASGDPAYGGNGGIGISNVSVGNLLSMTSAGVGGFIAGGGGGSGGGGNGLGGSGGGGGAGDPGVAGTSYTGSGGGASSGGQSPGAGGSGIVIIAYATVDFSFTYTGAYTTGVSGSLTWIKMTGSGMLTLTSL